MTEPAYATIQYVIKAAPGEGRYADVFPVGWMPEGGWWNPMGLETPAGYLPCDGAAYWPWQHWELFKALRYTFGRRGIKFCVPRLDGLARTLASVVD